jgi:hypothetical protein
VITTRQIHITDEKKILVNLITNQIFLDTFIDIIEKNIQYLKSSYSKIIIEWIIDFYRQFKSTIKDQLQDVYNNQKDFLKKDESDAIGKFLISLSETYTQNDEKFNLAYEIKKATNYLKLQRLIQTKNQIEECIRTENVDEAESCIGNYRKEDTLENAGVDLLRDTNTVISAIIHKDQNEFLFKLSGEAGSFFGDFCRSDFVAIMAAYKAGKTWCLQELAFRAMEHNCKIIYFDFETTQNKLIRRFWSGFLGLPIQEIKELKIPYFIDNIIEYKTVKKEAIQIKDVKEYMEDVRLHRYKANIRLFSYEMQSKTINDIKNILNSLEYLENFIPDVLIVDGLDLCLSNFRGEYRHQINKIWMDFRSLVQARNILGITVTQSNKIATKNDVEASNVAEDARKLGHVTKLIGLNQSSVEKGMGLNRWVMLEDRDVKFLSHKQMLATECREIGRIMLDTRKIDDVVNYTMLIDKEKGKKGKK